MSQRNGRNPTFRQSGFAAGKAVCGWLSSCLWLGAAYTPRALTYYCCDFLTALDVKDEWKHAAGMLVFHGMVSVSP